MNNKNQATRWGYRIPGNFYSYKTTEKFTTKQKAKDSIKETWEFKRLPNGFEIWQEE